MPLDDAELLDEADEFDYELLLDAEVEELVELLDEEVDDALDDDDAVDVIVEPLDELELPLLNRPSSSM